MAGTAEVPVSGALEQAPAPPSEFRRVVRVFFGRKLAVIGFVFVVALIITAIFAPLIAPHDPYKMDLANNLAAPSAKYLLGTDELGRDILSRIIWGSRISLIVGISVVLLAGIVGEAAGLAAAYFGGWVYTIIMRIIDTLMAFPMMLLFLIVAAMLGGGLKNVIFALALGAVSVHARLMCGQALGVKQNDYILAGRAMGASNLRIMLRHIFPNSFPPLLVLITLELGTVILAEAALSFLGIGIAPPIPSWGGMVNEGRRYLLSNPMLAFAPGFAIMLVVFGFNMMGDGLRDALDPRLRGTL
jgi:ABC-type dipeptide/oligopeptide/nickel transport system permease subunit